MIKNTFVISILTLVISSASAQNRNELALMLSPISFENQDNFHLLYRCSLKEKSLKLRSALNYNSTGSRSIRADSIIDERGKISYSISAGLQKDYLIEDLNKIILFVSVSGYVNAESVKTSTAGYGTFWNFGLRPTVGINYTPYSNIRLGLELVSDINRISQGYSGVGLNKDEAIAFIPYDGLAVSVGYLF